MQDENERPDTPAAPAAMSEVFDRLARLRSDHESLFSQLVAGERRFRRLARTAWRLQEEERGRLARELHDGIGQTLTALKNQLEHLRLGATPAEEPGLARAVELAGSALADTRQLSRLLRPPVLDDLGLEAAMRWLARTVGETAGLTVETSAGGLDGRLAPELETLAFRVLQEGLTNAVRHAAASHIQLAARREGELLSLVVEDDGCGFAAGEVVDGFGLRGLRDRVELVGGRLVVETRPGAGTRLAAAVPLAGHGEEEAP